MSTALNNATNEVTSYPKEKIKRVKLTKKQELLETIQAERWKLTWVLQQQLETHSIVFDIQENGQTMNYPFPPPRHVTGAFVVKLSSNDPTKQYLDNLHLLCDREKLSSLPGAPSDERTLNKCFELSRNGLVVSEKRHQIGLVYTEKGEFEVRLPGAGNKSGYSHHRLFYSKVATTKGHDNKDKILLAASRFTNTSNT